jgi:hypothetical protein
MKEGSAGLRKVVARLAEEHLVIHALIDELQTGTERILRSPGKDEFEKLRASFNALDRFVRSHFGYEETELEEALGFYGVLV